MTLVSSIDSIRASASPLISAKLLQEVQNEPNVKIFDVRGTWASPARGLPEDYAEGHIPNAVFLDWTRHFISRGVAPSLAAIASEAEALRSFSDLGIDADDLVILYDGSSHMHAGRIWLAMRHWGFTNVRVLDGGWGNWVAKGYPVSTVVPQTTSGRYEPVLQPGLKIDLDVFLAAQAEACVIDARGAANFAGNEDDPRTGHIPGALNVPFSEVLTADTGEYLDNAKIRETLDRLAPDWNSKPLIASCGSGYAATVILLALAKIGEKGTLFDGSFAEWKQDPNCPVVQGS